MRYLADTNVVSELMKPAPADAVIDWFQDNEGQVCISAVTVEELYFGLFLLPDGKRKERLKAAITGIVMDCSDKTLAFDAFSAYLCAELQAKAKSMGHVATIEDLMIASIALRNDAVLATRNTRDFDYLGIDCVNPFEARG